MIDTIPNTIINPQIKVNLVTPFVAACPYSKEPQEGSFISISYVPQDRLIELHSVELFLKSLSLGSDALDLETVAQLVFNACASSGISVSVKAHYNLKNGLQMDVQIGVI